MKKKFCLFITTSMFISMISFSQTIKENIEKQSKDPKTVENAAKADVYIVSDKKKISNTPSEESATNQNRTAKNSRKKKSCRKN